MASSIPVENIYYLLSYAWDRLEEAALTNVNATPETSLPDLFGRVLRSGVTHLLKRGLSREYVGNLEEIAGVRGRLNIGLSVKRATFVRARAWCDVDDLSADTPANRILRTTLRSLAQVSGLDSRLAEELRDLYRRMPGVQEVRITGQSFRRLTLGSNARYYGFLLDVCELIHRNLLADERTGAVQFRDFTRDDAQMAQLFERFLLRFYGREQSVFKVEAPHLTWKATGEASALEYMPRMRTDLVLRSPGRVIVVDAKYYEKALNAYWGKSSIHSEHLYQIHAYLRHLKGRAPSVEGVLLYPRTTQSLAIRFQLFDHPVQVATINLAQPREGIRADLLRVIAPSD